MSQFCQSADKNALAWIKCAIIHNANLTPAGRVGGTTAPWSATCAPSASAGATASSLVAKTERLPGQSSLASLINTALLNDADLQAWLTNTLERIVSGRTKSHQFAELLPWSWKAAHGASARDWLAARQHSENRQA